jgi:hypothetical protein
MKMFGREQQQIATGLRALQAEAIRYTNSSYLKLSAMQNVYLSRTSVTYSPEEKKALEHFLNALIHKFHMATLALEQLWALSYDKRGDLAINADMTRALRLVEELSGEKLLHIRNLKTGEEIASGSSIFDNTDNELLSSDDDDPDTLSVTDLTVIGDAILPDTVINGTLTIGKLSFDNNEASINALGTLSIQPLALGSINFLSGKVIMDEEGNITIAEGVLAGNDKMRGSVEIQPGQSEVEIHQEWDTTPVSVTVTPSFDTYSWITEKDADGFTLHVKTAPVEAQAVDWWAVW